MENLTVCRHALWRKDMLNREDLESGRLPEEPYSGGKQDAGTETVQMQQNAEEPVPAQNEQYRNFIVRYSQNVRGPVDYESDRTFQIINERFGIIYVPVQQVPELEFTSYTYSSIPKCYTYMDLEGLSASELPDCMNILI